MNNANLRLLPVPPSLTRSLLAGFDTISNHITLIVFSVVLDLFLWLGPRLRLEALMRDLFAQAVTASETSAPEMVSMFQDSQILWKQLLEQFNLFSMLQTLPVGIPSLLAGSAPLMTPLGSPVIWQVPSFLAMVGIWASLIGLGLLAGTLLFTLISQAALLGEVNLANAVRQWPGYAGQVILLSFIWLGLFLIVGIPLICMISFILLSGLNVGQFAFLFYFVLLAWAFFPLLFSPHGIFTNQSGVWSAVLQSVQLTRATLPTTGLFILAALLLSQGLNILWNMPKPSSWFAMVGILGHAFVTASLLAASFIYYRDAQQFMRDKALSLASQ